MRTDSEKLNRVIAYLCFVLAGFSMFRLLGSLALLNILIAFILAIAWFFAGRGLLRKSNRGRHFALWLFGLSAILYLISVYLAFLLPLLDSNVTDVGYVKWISLILLFICAGSFFALLTRRIKALYIDVVA